jgi:hypothetical protein
MAAILGKILTGREVLDGNEYRKCAFENCDVEYHGGDLPSLVDCAFTNIRWVWGHGAQRTMQFLSAIYSNGNGGQELVEGIFTAIRDGRFIVK